MIEKLQSIILDLYEAWLETGVPLRLRVEPVPGKVLDFIVAPRGQPRRLARLSESLADPQV